MATQMAFLCMTYQKLDNLDLLWLKHESHSDYVFVLSWENELNIVRLNLLVMVWLIIQMIEIEK